MEDKVQEVVKLQEVPRTGEHCGKPMRRFVIGEMTREPRYRLCCQVCEHQQDGGKVEA